MIEVLLLITGISIGWMSCRHHHEMLYINGIRQLSTLEIVQLLLSGVTKWGIVRDGIGNCDKRAYIMHESLWCYAANGDATLFYKIDDDGIHVIATPVQSWLFIWPLTKINTWMIRRFGIPTLADET